MVANQVTGTVTMWSIRHETDRRGHGHDDDRGHARDHDRWDDNDRDLGRKNRSTCSLRGCAIDRRPEHYRISGRFS